jgi:hypothetical protein
MSCEIIPNIPRAERPNGPEAVLMYYDGPLLMWLPVLLLGRCPALLKSHWADVAQY